ncbi:sigma-54-dependent transcriptional regulator [Pelagibacterium limicola]|uniref:sigma-54-dependent transcriptional regulator n=1 Tax=Pelagibacterium limicola TaxID=2791022 RepID=UPI0018AF7991|nr:sigma-54 dependent transcriptional regulator [Pelagibacterium limicola]
MLERKAVFIDDEPAMREAISQWLAVAGYEVMAFAEAEKAAAAIDHRFEGIVITDLRMPRMNGLELLRRILAVDPDIPVILMTGQGDIDSAVAAMRMGAYDFMEKPFDPERLAEAVKRASEKRQLVMENRRLQNALPGDALRNRILGTSRAIERLREDIAELAATEVSVILYGETGAGKDLVARCLHDLGRRAKGHYVAVNCTAIPETMVESEMFGHEAGAFTGATARRAGKIEYASGGTLFLDEIESMPLAMQAKLLRVLQEKSVERLGSNTLIPIDLRTVAAAKSDLRAASEKGSFRSDLYFRLSVVELHIPPLRERREDIPLLFEFFASRAAREHNRDRPPISTSAMDELIHYQWPGNVRELRNVAERHALGFGVSILPQGHATSTALLDALPLTQQMEAFERRIIERALADSGGRISDVIERLGVPRRTLNEKMARLGIVRPAPVDADRQ